MKVFFQGFLFCVTTALLSNSIAELCPSVEQVRANQLGAWQVFDADSGERLSPAQLINYEKNLRFFSEADYYEDAPEGPAQCYYDAENDPYHSGAYLAIHGLQPDYQQTSFWKNPDPYHYQCQQRDADHCIFVVLVPA
jgi:hypothetical protein